MTTILSKLNVYDVNNEKVILFWNSDPGIVSYNLYSATSFDDAFNNNFTLLQQNIPNQKEKDIFGGAVVTKVDKAANSFPANMTLYFKLTSIDGNGTESLLADERFISVDPLDDIFRSRQEHDDSVVYRNLSLTVTASSLFATQDFAIDVNEVLGRNANKLLLSTDTDIFVKLNSIHHDPILVTSLSPLDLDRRDLEVSQVFVENSGGSDAAIVLFLSS